MVRPDVSYSGAPEKLSVQHCRYALQRVHANRRRPRVHMRGENRRRRMPHRKCCSSISALASASPDLPSTNTLVWFDAIDMRQPAVMLLVNYQLISICYVIDREARKGAANGQYRS